jgi:hypothetical protein
MSFTVTERHSVIDRLAPVVEADLVLRRALARKVLWVGGRPVKLSGPDLVACAVAGAVARRPESRAAIAAPRGVGPLPVMLGAYLAMYRRLPLQNSPARLVGSVAVSTRRPQMRDIARAFDFGSEEEFAVPLAGLVGMPYAQNRVRAAALELHTRERDYLDQADSWLLFCRPNVAPPVAFNVISAMVVDTIGATPQSWAQTLDRNVAARRRQLWVGELGNSDFESFCAEQDIPLVRLDWGLLAAAAQQWGVGDSTLASSALAGSALAHEPIGAQVIRHEEAEAWLGELLVALANMQKVGRDEPPDVFKAARWAAALLARIAYPLGAYEREAAKMRFAQPVQGLIDRVDQVSASAFNNRWKAAYSTFWPLIKGCLHQLAKLIADPDVNPKWWALQSRLEQAFAERERVLLLCQTKAERVAVREALYAGDLLADDALDRFVTFSSFAEHVKQQTAPAETTTVLLGPPPERFAGVYLAAGRGRVEALCFPLELPRLRARAEAAAKRYTDPTANHRALDRLGINLQAATLRVDTAAAGPAVVELDGWQETDTFELPAELNALPLPDPADQFWERALELRTEDLPTDAADEDDIAASAEIPPGAPSLAVYVQFVDGPPMWLRVDADIAVVSIGADGEAQVGSVEAVRLEAGMRIAVLPGSERGSLLGELMAAWDDRLATVQMRYVPMYRRALALAEMNCGGAEGLAKRVGLSEAAIRTWLRGENRPGQLRHLQALLQASGDEVAIANAAVIHEYFARTRGAHRVIGRVLNECVEETVLYGAAGGETLAKLAELVNVVPDELTDIFDNVHVLRVASVSAPRGGIPAGVCGSLLDRDDPYLAPYLNMKEPA